MKKFLTCSSTVGFLLIALFISACGPLYEPIDITGKVIDSTDRQPIPEAVVKIISPSNFVAETFSNETGEFLFEEVSVDTLVSITIEVSKEGYNTQSISVDATPENDLLVPNIEVSSTETDQDTDEPDSKGSAYITLLSKSASSIQVKSTGGNETATFDFVVRDSTGTPVNSENAVTVNFEITAGPDGGEALFPLSAMTESGIAATTLNSGTIAGVVQIRASFERNGNIERSEPVPISIQGGLPNDNHFEVRTETKNISTSSSSENEISVLVGDKFGNVVIPGTAVYFSTNKGNIDGSAETDESGRASSILRSNNTTPGIANISVSTIGDENNEIERELEVIFSGEPEISVTPENVDLLEFESQNFTVTLSDANGNPLAAGTTLNVSVDNDDLVLNGDINVELTDTQSKGSGFTEFEFQLRNPDRVAINEDVTLSIQTNGPNGTESKNLTFEVGEIERGLPNDNHFDVRADAKNISTSSSSENEISVLVGDKFGNVVIPGTVVYFSTDKGNIGGSAETDESGRASSILRANNTTPGIANISVSTIGDEDDEIKRELEVIFSGEPEISITPENVDLLGFESQNFTVNLSDANGNPLAAGTTLNVSVDNEDLVLNGSTNVELTDTQRKGLGYTEFEFQLRNPDRVTINEDVTLSIQTNGPNGTESKNLTFEVDEAEPENPGSIFLENISLTDIGVRSTGQREDTQLTFQVIDINGNPLSNFNPVDVEFEFGDRPGGDEFLSPDEIRTNNLGQATVTLTSGTEAGTVQIVAIVNSEGRKIESEPVSVVINAGLPSERYFSIVPPQFNFPATIFGEQYEFLVLAGDRYSNTVPDDVAIYFETNGGFIDGSALTVGGRATAQLTMGNPIPSDGRVTVRAYSSDDNRNEIDDRTDVIFSRQPIIQTDTNSINLSNGDDVTINYTVEDINGFPMVEGTTISVTVEGEEIELIGDTEVTLRDVNPDFSNIEGLTEYRFNVKDADADNNEDSPVIITIEVDGPNGYAKKVIEGRKAKGI